MIDHHGEDKLEGIVLSIKHGHPVISVRGPLDDAATAALDRIVHRLPLADISAAVIDLRDAPTDGSGQGLLARAIGEARSAGLDLTVWRDGPDLPPAA